MSPRRQTQAGRPRRGRKNLLFLLEGLGPSLGAQASVLAWQLHRSLTNFIFIADSLIGGQIIIGTITEAAQPGREGQFSMRVLF